MRVLLFTRCTASCGEDQAGFPDLSVAVQFVITGLYINMYIRRRKTSSEDGLAIMVSIQTLLLWMKVGYFARCWFLYQTVPKPNTAISDKDEYAFLYMKSLMHTLQVW